LIDLINDKMGNMLVNDEETPPVISAWVAPDGHYAFVEFVTPEGANRGFDLKGLTLNGTILKVGRPKNYQQANSYGLPGGLSQNTATLMGMRGALTNAYNPLDERST